ncbi:hypothetical protein Tco_0037457 [Tanacetum coccineum]
MLIWCKLFHQTLGGATRNRFDDLDPKSVDNFEELSQKFLEEFSQQKSSHIKGVSPVLRISAFMHGHGHPKLAKKLNDKILKEGSQHQQLLSVKKANRGSYGFKKVAPSSERYPPDQLEERKPRKKQCKGHKHDKGRMKSKRSFGEERSGLTDELTFPAIPRNQLTDEPIILKGIIEGN